MNRLAALGALSMMLGGLTACKEPNPAFTPPENVCEANEFFVAQSFDLQDPGKVDVLLVVDNSPGMLANQRVFAAAMPLFVDRLNETDGLDWRVGVISTDLADQGAPQTGASNTAACPNELPTFVDANTDQAGVALGCNVILGQDGSDFEQGLEAARRAVEGNAPFLRDDARLVVVFFSDEDDCTAQASLDRSNPNNCVWQPNALVSAVDFGRYFASNARGADGNGTSIVSIVGGRDPRVFAAGEEPAAICTGPSAALGGDRYIDVTEVTGIGPYSFATSICSSSHIPTVERIVEDAIRTHSDELCPSLPLSGAPESLLVVNTDGTTQALTMLDDYFVSGPSESCPNGGVAVSVDAHSTDDRTNALEMRFCTTQNPAGS